MPFEHTENRADFDRAKESPDSQERTVPEMEPESPRETDFSFTAHSQVDISESEGKFYATDSRTGARGEGDTRGKALAELAAMLISGEYTASDRPKLFDLAGTADNRSAQRLREGAEAMRRVDISKNQEIDI